MSRQGSHDVPGNRCPYRQGHERHHESDEDGTRPGTPRGLYRRHLERYLRSWKGQDRRRSAVVTGSGLTPGVSEVAQKRVQSDRPARVGVQFRCVPLPVARQPPTGPRRDVAHRPWPLDGW